MMPPLWWERRVGRRRQEAYRNTPHEHNIRSLPNLKRPSIEIQLASLIDWQTHHLLSYDNTRVLLRSLEVSHWFSMVSRLLRSVTALAESAVYVGDSSVAI